MHFLLFIAVLGNGHFQEDSRGASNFWNLPQLVMLLPSAAFSESLCLLFIPLSLVQEIREHY